MPSRLRFAKRSSTRAAALVAVVAAAAVVSVVGLALGSSWLAFAGLAVAIVGAAGFALHLIVTERRRHEVVEEQPRAALLADFASRTVENARLLAEAQVRETERARLSDQLITAEQDKRRRLALFLHDGPVQSLSGISLMLDAVVGSLQEQRLEEAEQVLSSALKRHRDTIRSLRDLSFHIEPVVLRDQGFGPAVKTFAEQVGLENRIQVDLDVDAADALTEQARVVLYQIIREAVNQAIRRGPPSRIAIRVAIVDDGSVEAVIADDGTGERRRATFDEIEERARTLSGRLNVEAGEDGGTEVRVLLPPYVARR